MKNEKLYYLVCEKIKEYLEVNKVKIDNIKLGEMPIYLFEYKLRTLEEQNYEVLFSKELLNNTKYTKYKTTIEAIKAQAQSGQNLNKYLSKGIRNIMKPDKMLNEWGIMHMHLSDTMDDEYFVERSDDLLFLFRQDNKLYFLDIYRHKKSAWTKKRTIEILNNNWDVLKNDALKVDDLCFYPSEDDIKNLREENINSPLLIGDDVFGVIGGGMTLDGTNVLSVMNRNALLKYTARIERNLNQDEIKNVKLKIKNDKIIILSNTVYIFDFKIRI
nr:hypothetical protein [uncultured Campylobacter sp.]